MTLDLLVAAGKAIAVLTALAVCLFGLWAIVSDQTLYLTHERPPPEVGEAGVRTVGHRTRGSASAGAEAATDPEATADTGDSSPPPTERSDRADTEEPPPSTPPPDEPGPPTPPEP